MLKSKQLAYDKIYHYPKETQIHNLYVFGEFEVRPGLEPCHLLTVRLEQLISQGYSEDQTR